MSKTVVTSSDDLIYLGLGVIAHKSIHNVLLHDLHELIKKGVEQGYLDAKFCSFGDGVIRTNMQAIEVISVFKSHVQ